MQRPHTSPRRAASLTLRSIIGFDEMGGHDDFPTMHLEWLLAKWKVGQESSQVC